MMKNSPIDLSLGPRGDAVEAITMIYRECANQRGLKALTFIEVHDIFYRVFGDNERQARRRIGKWRGTDSHDKLKEYGHEHAWIEKLATGKRCYRVSDFALRKAGLSREAARRVQAPDLERQYVHDCLSDKKKTPFAEQLAKMFAEVFPAGGDINALYYCLGTLGSRVNREGVARYAWNLAKRGYLESTGHGVYRAKLPAQQSTPSSDRQNEVLQCVA